MLKRLMLKRLMLDYSKPKLVDLNDDEVSRCSSTRMRTTYFDIPNKADFRPSVSRSLDTHLTVIVPNVQPVRRQLNGMNRNLKRLATAHVALFAAASHCKSCG